jgi:hypothetical protein
VSREGSTDKKPTPDRPRRPSGTPIWVWVVYTFGILAAAIFVFSLLFTLGAVLLSEDAGVTYDVSTLAIILWGGLILAAVVTWVVRRRQR